MAPIPTFDAQLLQSICDTLGDTSEGLTGSEIGKLLEQCGIHDSLLGNTKRDRLYEALRIRQERDRNANHIVAFIKAAMKPVRYINKREQFVFLRR